MQTLNINNSPLAYHDSGCGVPLLLVHGFPLDHTMWKGQFAALSDRCRIIAPDLRGFGGSGVSECVVNMELMADDLAALLDALSIDEPIVLCGLSMGGYIAFEFWRKYASRLCALILCDTRASADRPEVAASRLATADRVLREGTQPLVESMLPKIFSPQTFAAQPRKVEEMERIMMHTDPRGIAAASRGMAQRRDYSAELVNIQCPTLVLVGAEDALSPPAEMQPMAAAIPNAEYKIIPNAGHMSPLEQPDAVNAVIESFLASLEHHNCAFPR
jgi:3-oxoadipate enol-lactonase